MASVYQDIIIAVPPERVWAAVRDIGAVHQRLLPGRVLDTRIEGEMRILTFPSGGVARERIITVDDETRRLVYAVVEGRMPLNYHHASFQVFDDGEGRSRLVWITDFLPDIFASEIRDRTERGADDMRQTLEEAARHG